MKGVSKVSGNPFDSKTISKITCLNKYMIINILASYAYLSANTIIIIMVPFRNFYANRSLTVSLTSTHSSNIIQSRYNSDIVIINYGF